MTDHLFIDFIKHICKKPSMYTGGSIKETLAFIDGYRFGNSTPISGRVFDRFVCIRNSFPEKYAWSHVINICSKDNNDSFFLIEENITEFIRLKACMTDEEIISFASTQLPEETEAEKAFRNFEQALLKGEENIIRPLIEDHVHSELLWQGCYPNDVADLMNSISANQRIRGIPISADGKTVKIIANTWSFPIEMNFINGAWLVNADPIIEQWFKVKAIL